MGNSGEKVEVDPKSYVIQDGRLLVFYNGFIADTRKKWVAGNVTMEGKQADVQWQKLSGETAPKPMATSDATSASKPGPLNQALNAKRAEFAKAAPPEKIAAYDKAIMDVKATNIEATALKVGAKAPMFDLPTTDGKTVSLQSMLDKGPVVLTWYRGTWCPYCNMQLRSYDQMMPELSAAGAQLVAISPQVNIDKSDSESKPLSFPLAVDRGNKVAASYGLSYEIAPELRAGFGPMLTKVNDDPAMTLPLSATYVIDRDGTIAFSYVDADYRTRAEPSDILEAVSKLSKAR